MRGLAKQPGERFDSTEAFRKALVSCDAARAWGAHEANAWWESHQRAIDDFRARKRDGTTSGTGHTIAIDLDRRAGCAFRRPNKGPTG